MKESFPKFFFEVLLLNFCHGLIWIKFWQTKKLEISGDFLERCDPSLQFWLQKTKNPRMDATFMEHIWVFPKIVGFPPKSSHFIRVFHYVDHPFWGFPPIFGNIHMGNVSFREIPSFSCIQRTLRPVPLHLPNCERCLVFWKLEWNKNPWPYWKQQMEIQQNQRNEGWYSWWKERMHQLSLVVEIPFFIKVFLHPRLGMGFLNYQQYLMIWGLSLWNLHRMDDVHEPSLVIKLIRLILRGGWWDWCWFL